MNAVEAPSSRRFAPGVGAAFEALARVQPMRIAGRVAAIRGMTVLVDELPLPVGALVSIRPPGGESVPSRHDEPLVFGEVVGLSREQAVVMLLGQSSGIRAGDRVVGEQSFQSAGVGARLLGRVIDGMGRPLDGLGVMSDLSPGALSPEPISAMRRRAIDRAMHTGVRVLDLMTTLGRGQRLGIFAGPGVGKSTLLGTIARRSDADVNVIALIGERGREVKDFLAHSLGPEGLSRSVVVVATGDESPLMRLRAARVACAAAEHFRDAGRDVMLMMDSITRFAHAQRQVGLAVGEPPATKGYTPSVFAQLALLLERAGAVDSGGTPGSRAGGSITGLYTILVEGDDMTEPVADAARGILDGHVILSRKLAQRAQYPAVDVLDSVSRVANDVCDPEHIAARRRIVRLMAMYRDVEDLVQIGAYARGVNPESDAAVDLHGQIVELLRQDEKTPAEFTQARASLVKLAATARELSQPRKKER
jgi:flagellum-specific ATP synthase